MSVADVQGWRPRFRISYGALLLILVAILLLMPPMVEAGYGLLVMSTLFPASFTAGSEPGRYFTTFELYGGNSLTMVVDVVAGN